MLSLQSRDVSFSITFPVREITSIVSVISSPNLGKRPLPQVGHEHGTEARRRACAADAR